MAGRGHQTFAKRQRERAKQERAAQKRERREERKSQADAAEDGGLDEDALLEQFRVLSEKHDAGEISDESFEERRAKIFEQLGLGEPTE